MAEIVDFPTMKKKVPPAPTPAQRAAEIAAALRSVSNSPDAHRVRMELRELAHKLDALAVNLGPTQGPGGGPGRGAA